VKLSEDYRTRPIRFLELWENENWKLKVYGITFTNDTLDQILVKAVHKVTFERLEISGSKTNHYGVGFVGIHQGKTGNFVFVDWWADENELHHHVYVSPSEDPLKLEYMTPTGLAACAWDLFLISYERDAWVRYVLKQSESPNIEGYLSAHLNENV